MSFIFNTSPMLRNKNITTIKKTLGITNNIFGFAEVLYGYYKFII